MNTLQYQSSVTLPDEHGHVCEHCNTSFTHIKSLIAPGKSHDAHECPGCGKPVNVRVELEVLLSPPRIRPDYIGWYGPGGPVDLGSSVVEDSKDAGSNSRGRRKLDKCRRGSKRP